MKSIFCTKLNCGSLRNSADNRKIDFNNSFRVKCPKLIVAAAIISFRPFTQFSSIWQLSVLHAPFTLLIMDGND
jgi:hypothetical protein